MSRSSFSLQDEYTETVDENTQAGLKVLVHDHADPPLMDSLGSAIPPGYYAFMAIRNEQVSQIQGDIFTRCSYHLS